MSERRVREVLHAGDPRGHDYRDAAEWVSDIRSRLVQIRGELEDIGRIESSFPHDRLCDKVAASMTLALMALYTLVDDEPRSLTARATFMDGLWARVESDPEGFLIEDGTTWDWKPLDIYKRGGRP